MHNPSRMALVVIPFFVFAAVWMTFRFGHGPRVTAWAETTREWFAATFGWLYLGVGAASIVVVLLAWMLIGSVRVGGDEAPARVTPFEAVAVGFAASTSIGLLFWAGGEPLFHVHQTSPLDGMRPLSRDAQVLARSMTYLNLGLLSHALFGAFMIAFAISTGTLQGRRSLESAIAGARVYRRAAWGDFLDAVVFVFVILALISALFSATVSVTAQGLALTGGAFRPGLLTGVLVLLTVTGVFLGARPLGSSLATVARVSLILLLVFLAVVLVFGPKGYTLGGGLKALWWTIRYLPTLMFGGLAGAGAGEGGWTVAHLGGWMLLAPLVGYTLSRAAQGYTLADAILYLVAIPVLLSILCILVLGGLTLAVDGQGGRLWAQMPRLGTDNILLAALNGLWPARFLRALLMILSVLAFVTFLGAMTHAIVHVTVPGKDGDRRTIVERRTLLVVWAVGIGLAAWFLLHYGGSQPVTAASQLGAVPGVLVAFGTVLAVFRLALTAPRRLRPPVEEVDAPGRGTQNVIGVRPARGATLRGGDRRRN